MKLKDQKKELNVDKINGSVLVVDDEEIIRDVIFDALTIKGLDVHMAKSSEEAIGFFEGQKQSRSDTYGSGYAWDGRCLGRKGHFKKNIPTLK